MAAARHILVLVDRDWTHPQAGGTGTVLRAQVTRWVDAGHRVTVIGGSYDGAEPVSRPHERLAVHRMGTRLTVFPRAAWATLRGVGRDADASSRSAAGSRSSRRSGAGCASRASPTRPSSVT